MKNKIFKEICDYLVVIVIAIVVATIINVFLFTFSNVKQQSMEPTLIEGDMVVVEKISLWLNNIDKGDIVVLLNEEQADYTLINRIGRIYKDMFNKFKGEENRNRLVKRVIAVAGDEIDIRDGSVYINGEKLDEDYLDIETPAKSYLDYPYVVPEDEVFVMGDNRGNSNDSRNFGSVKFEMLEGKVTFRLWPLSKIGKLQ